MAVSFRDRFFTPPVARAMTSPSGILAAGVGGAAGMLTGVLPLAVVGAAVGWAIRVAAAVPRTPAAERIDAFTLNEPWRQLTRDALGSEMEFQEAVRKTPNGPMRERLEGLDARIEAGVQEAWRVARAGDALSDAYTRINVEQDRRALAELTNGGDLSPIDEQTAASIQAQIQTADRMARTITEARDKLRLLNARMGELVARTIELSVSSQAPESLDSVAGDITVLTDELEALRQAVDVTSEAERYGTGAIDLPPGEARPGGAV